MMFFNGLKNGSVLADYPDNLLIIHGYFFKVFSDFVQVFL